MSTKLLPNYYFSKKIVPVSFDSHFFLFAGKLTLIQSRAEAAAAAKAAEAAQPKQKKEARHHNPSPHLSDGSKQKKEINPKTDEELESTRCRRYSERKRHLSQTTKAETKRPRSSSGRSTEKEVLSTAKIVAESLPVPHLDASKYLPWKGSRTAPSSIVVTRVVPASSVTCSSAVHPSPVTCLTAVPLSHTTDVSLSHPPAVPLSHPTAVPPSSVTVTTAVHPPSVTCTTAVRSTVRQAVVESRSPSKATRSKLCPDSSKDADRSPFKSPAKKADSPSLQRKRPCSGGDTDNSAKENETPVVFDLRSKLRHSSGNRNDPTPRSNSASAKSDLRQVSDLELTHTPLVHRVEKPVHLRLGRQPLACDDAEKETRQKKSPEKCNVPKTLELPRVPDVLSKNTIQNTLVENRTSHSRKDDQKSISSLSTLIPQTSVPVAPAEDLEEGEITDEDVGSDVEQQATRFSGSGSSSGREMNTNGSELQSQKLPDTKMSSDSSVRKSEDVFKRCSRESLSELEPVTTHASRKEPKLMMTEKCADENLVKKSGKHLKVGKSREEEAAKENTNRGRERIELESKLDVGGCGQQEPRVLLKRLKIKELQQVERLQPAKEQTPPNEELSKESKKAEKEKRGQEVQKRLLDKLEKQRMLQVQKIQLLKESGQDEKELQLEKLGTSREQVPQEEKCRKESQERLLKKDKNRKQEIVAEKKDKKSEQVAQELLLEKPGHKSRQELQKAQLQKSDEKCLQVDQGLQLEKQKMMSEVLEKDGEMCGRRQEGKQSKTDEKSHQNKEKEEKDRRRSSSHQKQQREKEEEQDGERNNSQKNQTLVHNEEVFNKHGNVQIKKPENNMSLSTQNHRDQKKANDCLQESKDTTERGKEESPKIENRGRKHQSESFLSKESAADSRKGKLLSSEKAGKESKSRRESVKRQDRKSTDASGDVISGAVTVLPSRHAARPVRSMKDFCDQLVETLFPEQGDEKGGDASDGAAMSVKLKKHAVVAESVLSLDKEAVMANKAEKSNSELNASRTAVAVETGREIVKDTREDLSDVKAAVKVLEKDKKDAGKDKELAKAAERKKKSSDTLEAVRKAFKTAEKAAIVEKKTANAVMEEKVTSKSANMNGRTDKTAEKSKRVAETAEESIRAKKPIEVVMGDSKSEKAVALNKSIPGIGEKNERSVNAFEVSKTATEDATKTLPQNEAIAQTVGLDTKVAKTMEEDKRPSKPTEVEKGAAMGDSKAAGSKTGMAVKNCKDSTRTLEVLKKVADREISADSSTTHAKKLMPVCERGVDDEGRKASAEKQNLKTGDTTFDESEDPSIPDLIDERVDGRIASASGKRAISKRSSGDLEQLKGMIYKYWFKEILNAQNLLRLP